FLGLPVPRPKSAAVARRESADEGVPHLAQEQTPGLRQLGLGAIEAGERSGKPGGPLPARVQPLRHRRLEVEEVALGLPVAPIDLEHRILLESPSSPSLPCPRFLDP